MLANRAGVSPELLAARLAEHGLRRASILAFTALSERSSEWAPWLEALRPRRAERLLAASAVRAIASNAERPYLAAAIPRAFGDGAWDIARSLALYASLLVRDWSRPRRLALVRPFGSWFPGARRPR